MVHLSVIEQLDAAESALQLAAADAIRRCPGNPYGIHIVRSGALRMVASERLPDWNLNRVFGLRAGGEPVLKLARETAARLGSRLFLVVIPEIAGGDLLRAIRSLGFRFSFAHATFSGSLAADPAPGLEGIRVERFDHTEARRWSDESIRVDRDLWRHPETACALRKLRSEAPGWWLYLAYHDTEPVAWARLHVSSHMAVLHGALTGPDWRGRGLQQLLIRRRLHDARLLGCRSVVSHARHRSTSARNLERAGLHHAMTKAIWEQPR